MTKPIFPTGSYRHFKGGRYRVLDVVKHSETDEWMVLYHPINSPQPLWVRPLEMFEERVERDGKTYWRFQLEAD